MPPSGHQPVASGPVSAARAGTPGRRTWPQRLLITFNVFLIVTCLVIAGGLIVYAAAVHPGGYSLADIPRVFFEVLGRFWP